MAHGDMFAVLAILDSLTGGEVVLVLIVALMVLGPDRLPEAMRTLGVWISKLRSMTSDLQGEVREVFDDPSMQPIREVGEFMASPRRKLVEYATAAEAEAAAEAIAVSEALAASGVDPVAEAEAADDAQAIDAGGSQSVTSPGGVPDHAAALGAVEIASSGDITETGDIAGTAATARPDDLAGPPNEADTTEDVDAAAGVEAPAPAPDPLGQHLAARVAELAAQEAERNKQAAFGFYEAL